MQILIFDHPFIRSVVKDLSSLLRKQLKHSCIINKRHIFFRRNLFIYPNVLRICTTVHILRQISMFPPELKRLSTNVFQISKDFYRFVVAEQSYDVELAFLDRCNEEATYLVTNRLLFNPSSIYSFFPFPSRRYFRCDNSSSLVRIYSCINSGLTMFQAISVGAFERTHRSAAILPCREL